MAPDIIPVETSSDFPAATTVVVIGGGIVGLVAALTLAERGVPVVVLEKGRIAGEQSSRNLGWVRKMLRPTPDLPMAQAAEGLWAEMPRRVGGDCGYRPAGIMYVARTPAEMAAHERWLDSVKGASLDSRLLSPREITELAPGAAEPFVGGIYTPSDGRAEPTFASSAIARAAMAKGAVIVENCAVRTLSTAAGAVGGVVTERGEIRCEQVILAGGVWSRRFLGNLGIRLLTLPLVASVLRTDPMQGPTDIAVGGPDFSFRKRHDGGYTITQRGALFAPLLLDHLLIGPRYLSTLMAQWKNLRVTLGRDFLDDLALPRRWGPDSVSPFELVRTMDPPVNVGLNEEAMVNLTAAWPAFRKAWVAQAWGGMIDVTPDSLPVIGPVAGIPGLILASGFSGHGFGTAPAAGQLAADLVMGRVPLIDPAPYRLDRFQV
ncbi:FAD dependent oxidoreductase [Nitrospirillum viridazoti Y2]|uniref:Glycine/D-amino acid oxidase-like deaminating enzyme n=1 Tax=Nitrospirillum amazonense TaxID=28077 RepID=A0A560J0T8_9PROT|nr:FAD-binding oxidoreductase [Nitrospirillum amazonense]EGY02388.1 FAD dependent oxidoreductase [Nitrospirillum amazonense Y2]TWB64375.1 glycine/D-amino acid oxidase-like deaminating enzyme [Nitrospirillum amazonense]